jgi:hypothetical protein
MRITATVERVYEMDVARVLAEPGFDPPPPDTPEEFKQRWLRETFWELCGFDRDVDHVDGKYIWLVQESGDVEFDWPRAPAVAR